MTVSTVDIVNQYLEAFYSGDFSVARNFVADNFEFKGPFVNAASREAFFSSAAGLADVVKGHKMLRQWQDGKDVCSIYEVNLETPFGKGVVTMSEWHTMESNQLTSGHVILDTATFRALMPPR